MIVVDSNVIAYCWIRGEQTALAHRLRRLDQDWRAPLLWRSELRNILTGYRRDGSLTEAQVRQIIAAAEAGFTGREHHLPSERVFGVTERYPLSAYDAEFVALAEILGVPLVTEDRAILRCWPGKAFSLRAAVDIQ